MIKISFTRWWQAAKSESRHCERITQLMDRETAGPKGWPALFPQHCLRAFLHKGRKCGSAGHALFLCSDFSTDSISLCLPHSTPQLYHQCVIFLQKAQLQASQLQQGHHRSESGSLKRYLFPEYNLNIMTILRGLVVWLQLFSSLGVHGYFGIWIFWSEDIGKQKTCSFLSFSLKIQKWKWQSELFSLSGAIVASFGQCTFFSFHF